MKEDTVIVETPFFIKFPDYHDGEVFGDDLRTVIPDLMSFEMSLTDDGHYLFAFYRREQGFANLERMWELAKEQGFTPYDEDVD